ncbi:glycine--tRNA ligase [Candidatus Kaiserbacteria bacterium CG10_big_fil_rev_8_21_14_0_10_56_12]|uniref:Glycine--tRNA ligase n=1 Tax=Candidatus Kaiserbacteria bacterium CG10_big_fil_rev_8_21_14_0_10_56_12 TaxID=1974611 RepID=A0A2H0UBN4_9BACT|nr:MAG: glycine--tRNA ligase [Candidatus Kaiserbacteria bacterium CG10_big_fil_rev_8_21_14_0_10_56_12]
MDDQHLMEKIVSLCKRRGFVFPGSEIYGGLAGTYDYGPLGVLLQENVKQLWYRRFVNERDDMYPIDAAIIMNPHAWEASGHVAGFADPTDDGKMFNVMFKTSVGAGEEATVAYLRPETAGGMFVNFKNVVDSMHPKLPFGLGQVGKAFRNEIAPRDFIFRQREFKQMEVEYFVRPAAWESSFEEWRLLMHRFAEEVGLSPSALHELDVPENDRAHYSQRTIDFEFDYPFGRKELWGLAYRGDFDLSAHAKASQVDLSYLDEETGERFIPHVIEPSLGVDRTVLAILASAYREDDMGGETRTYLALAPKIAPIKAMVSPLLKNKPELVAKAKEVRTALQKVHPWIAWDDNGNIGKRYRRQDEIGTPFCVTVDFDTLGEHPELADTVTLRHRDTGEQERLSIEEVAARLRAALE